MVTVVDVEFKRTQPLFTTSSPRMPFARARTNITHRLCTTTASSYQPLFRSRTFAHSPNSKPWYVDHEENESSKQPEIAAKSQRKVPILPAPKDSPAYLARAYSFLSASPLIDNSTLSIGRPPSADTHPESDLPLPLLKSVRKARSNRNILGYGDGVGEGPGQGVYNWQLVAQVLEGTEARGAIEVVSRSLRDTVSIVSLKPQIVPQF